MTDLTTFASLSLPELTAKLERMIDNHYAPKRNYAARNISTPATAPDCREALPAGRGVAGNYSERIA